MGKERKRRERKGTTNDIGGICFDGVVWLWVMMVVRMVDAGDVCFVLMVL